jgi:hypothetical protein
MDGARSRITATRIEEARALRWNIAMAARIMATPSRTGETVAPFADDGPRWFATGRQRCKDHANVLAGTGLTAIFGCDEGSQPA